MNMETVIVGYNDSDASRAALRWVIDYAEDRSVELVVVTVVSSFVELEFAAAQMASYSARDDALTHLNGQWTAPLRERGIAYRTGVGVGRPAAELMRIAREDHASLIVVGMSERGTLSELAFGSTQHSLLHHALRPVVAVPTGWTAEPAA
ncbi:MAG: universal stress protein [Acidimicrobiia bacterium]